MNKGDPQRTCYYPSQFPQVQSLQRHTERFETWTPQGTLSNVEEKEWFLLHQEAEQLGTAIYHASSDLKYLIDGIQEGVKEYLERNSRWEFAPFCGVLYLSTSFLTIIVVMAMRYKHWRQISA